MMSSPVTPSVSAGILLHVCCGPCASACVEHLLAENRNCILYYSNSNLVHEA
ncbi:MAG: epoxyqueuosine reductase QueH, partial [Lentisphaeria bacterium]|nr:epoxyqueuosine reductase QueH [Lentisphaeria bacterium]